MSIKYSGSARSWSGRSWLLINREGTDNYRKFEQWEASIKPWHQFERRLFLTHRHVSVWNTHVTLFYYFILVWSGWMNFYFLKSVSSSHHHHHQSSSSFLLLPLPRVMCNSVKKERDRFYGIKTGRRCSFVGIGNGDGWHGNNYCPLPDDLGRGKGIEFVSSNYYCIITFAPPFFSFSKQSSKSMY